MKAKEKLYYLITNYLKGKYSTRAFCNEYTQVYNIDLDKKNLQECEFALLESICKLAERFSPFQEDILTNDFFIDETTFQKKLAETIKKFVNLLD